MGIKNSEIPFEYNRITKHIYIGTNQCCVMDFKKELLSKGIRADISLENDRVDSPKGVKHFLWLPVKDHYAPTTSQLEIGVACIQCCVANNVKVYVHCRQGHGRAPTLVAAYLISTGMRVGQAIDFIAEKRPVVHLTKRQLTALRAYERRTKRN